MSITTTALAALSSFMISVGAPPPPSDGLHTLATTGWADAYAKETGGMAYDNIGGTPAMFEYEVSTDWQFDARKHLAKGEFLAPHFAKGMDGRITVMIAPHLVLDGELMKNVGPDDSFLVINPNGETNRFDYSDDVMGDNMTMEDKMKYKKMMMKEGMKYKGKYMKDKMMKMHDKMHDKMESDMGAMMQKQTMENKEMMEDMMMKDDKMSMEVMTNEMNQ